jgi:hypothetical protein
VGEIKVLSKFLIFSRVGPEIPGEEVSGDWKELDAISARDRDHALRLFAAKLPASQQTAGTFVAVSEHAWNPSTVKVTSIPKVEISAA